MKWMTIGSPSTSDLRSIQFFDEQRGIIVGAGGTILRTNNGGMSWTKVETDFPLSLFGIAIN